MLIDANLADLARFSACPEYRVLRKDRQAHVITCPEIGLTCYAVFQADALFKEGVVQSVERPCLIMITVM
jgi:hypothetical protein